VTDGQKDDLQMAVSVVALTATTLFVTVLFVIGLCQRLAFTSDGKAR